MKYRVAAVQMNVVPVDKEANIKKALEFYDQAVQEGAKVVCFPEYFLTFPPHAAMTPEYVRDLAEPIPGPSIDRFREKAKATKTYCVAGSIIELCEDGKLRNTSTLIGPDGEVIGKYSKAHPENAPAKYGPASGIYPGKELPIFETELGRFAIMLDMDASCPEIARTYGLKGADIIFSPISWSAKFINVIETFSRANSMYSLAYVVFANPVGWRKGIPLHGWAFAAGETPTVDLMYGGGSGVASGVNLISRVNNFAEGIAVVTVDTETPKKNRENDATIYPFWRRPDLYGTLCDSTTNRPYGTNFKHNIISSLD
ncbi:MAG: carbon-nitrogen hydrolase family protein, partial [Clostridia bacterium]|nr:carbon-nitrogen hydrolase family protein [Clostridia bacterium]MDD4666063.1 carbon-nitrogen hydrolase family protein [Clostridia bacterium]